MYYCKDLNSLSVLSLYEGDLIGKVDKLYFDKKLKKLCEIELVCEDGAKMVLPTKNIYKVGKNALTVKNNQAVCLKTENKDLCVAPCLSKVYSITGEFLGVVEELSFDEKFRCDKISLDNGSVLDVKDIASCGKNTIILYNNGQKINLKNFTPTVQPKDLKTEEVKAETLPIKEKNITKEDKVFVAFQNTKFLIGRVCQKDIFNFNNELLIKAHSVITEKNLKDVSRFGKLRELMLFSK